jgi:hypothetical protein
MAYSWLYMAGTLAPLAHDKAVQFGKIGAAIRWHKGKVDKTLPWQEQELIRVRAHVARINRLVSRTKDPQDIMRFAAALRTFYEVAGLPKAGAYRPTEAKKPRSSGFTPAPQDIEPG